ncbi:MAG: N-6 DNA methylase [Elusimicrobia bacterium]|nr:N-6 DNA methylase [Elusimicrobiota bacterium]
MQNILPLMAAQYGFPAPEDEERVKINEIPVRIGSGTKKPDTVYYHNGVPVFLIEAKKEGKSEEEAVDQALSYIRGFPVKKYSKDGVKPRFFAVTIGKRVACYAHQFKIEGDNLKDWSEKLEAPLHFSDLLVACGLAVAEKKKILSPETFCKEVINELTAVYKLGERITPEVVKNASEQILAFLEYGRDFTGHRPYLDLEKHKDRQAATRRLYDKIDWQASLGSDIARTFRSYILRAFQGTLNQYLTEQSVIAFMANLVGGIGPKTRVIDFECGSGGFLAAAIEQGAALENILGVDIDELPYTIAKTYLALYFKKTGKAEIDALPIRRDNGLLYCGKDWDLVIGNPAGSDEYKHGNEIEIGKHLNFNLNKKGKKKEKGGKFSEYNFSVQQALASAKVGGQICLVLPEGFFSNSQDDFLRKFTAKHCRVLAIVSLPRGVFKKGVSTLRHVGGAQVASMKMSILFAEKVREVDAADPIGNDDFSSLGYPVFLASAEEPESKSGPVCDWIEPRLAAVLEQWKEWRQAQHLKPATAKIKTRDRAKRKKPTIAPLPGPEGKTGKRAVSERGRVQSKTETKISKGLQDIFE